MIDSLWAAGEAEACWAHLAAAIEPARAADDSAYLLDLISVRGSARARLGLVAAAEPDLREAVALAERLGADGTLRRSLRWLGFSLYRLGRADEAARSWERLLALAHAAGDAEHEAWARAGLALHHQDAGQPRRAREEYEQALALFRTREDARGAAYVLNGLGIALQSLGHYEDALARYEDAAASARELAWPWLEAVAQNNIATLHFSLGDPGQAREGFLRTVQLHQAAGDAAEAALAGANVAKCETALGRFEEAAAQLEQIRATCRELGVAQYDASLCNALAGIRYDQGRIRLAARLHRETLAAEPPAPAKARVEALLALARELTALDSVPAALLALRQASTWVAALDDPRLRLEYRLELGRQCLASGDGEEAWPLLGAAAGECGRLGLRSLRLPALAAAARAAWMCGRPDSALTLLGEATVAWEAERGLPVDPEWREVRGLAATEIRMLLGTLLLAHPPEASEAERARAAFDAVQVFKARTLSERMHGPAGIEAPALAYTPITCERLQRETLRAGELLLDFHIGAQVGLLFAVTPSECRGVRLAWGPAVDEALALYVRMSSALEPDRHARGESDPRGDSPGPASPAPAQTRDRIRTLLLGPVADLIAGSRGLIVVPDGILQRVGFADLLVEELPRGGGSAPMPRALQTVPSTAVLAMLRASRPAAGPRAEGDATVLALAGELNATGRPLPEARAEVRDLARRFRRVQTTLAASSPADPRIASSSAAGLLGELGRHAILHFAAHATVEDEHPWRSRLHLTGGAPAGGGASLTATDIARARLTARLAVLSSCRSAGGRLLSGEGVQGLAGAFLVAGAPAVVATLWPVDDTGARAFMGRFYDHLAGGATVAAALALAQADLRGDARLARPCHWAGFVVIGDGDATVPLERRSPLARLALPLGLLLLGIVAVLSLPLRRYLHRRL